MSFAASKSEFRRKKVCFVVFNTWLAVEIVSQYKIGLKKEWNENLNFGKIKIYLFFDRSVRATPEAIVECLIYRSLDDALSADFHNRSQSFLSENFVFRTCQVPSCEWSRHL